MTTNSDIIVYTDGGARGNPGVSGAGAVIQNSSGGTLATISEFLGKSQTNNYAEYTAIIMALKKIKQLGLNKKDIVLKADSKLAIEQLNGNWKVKDANIKILFNKVQDLLNDFTNIKFMHVPRGENKLADALANKAMDKGE